MGRVLGLDLGTNSLGWAVIDGATCDIFDRGVVVFPEGVNAGDDLETPATTRRNARAARRLKFRRRWRKWQLLEILIANGMCPMTADELKAWRERGEYPVGNRDFIEWLKSSDVRNPYADRAAAISGKVDPFVLGRALYHIVQRRGFKSSRKGNQDGEEGEGKKDSGKSLGAVKGGIAELTEEIERAGCRTLGEYFAKIIRDNASLPEKIRVRKRYIGRIEHYLKEFETICDVQGLNSKLREDLRKEIFHQRPLRSQKHLVGKCPLEPRSPRARTAHPLFEEFRLRSFINNLSLEKKPSPGEPEFARGETTSLSRSEKTRIYDCLTSVGQEIPANGKKKRGNGGKRGWTIGGIEAALDGRLERESLRVHYYEAADALPAAPTSALLRECFGRNLSEADAAKVFDALVFYDDDKKLAQWFAKHYPELDEGKIKKFCSHRVEEGYAKYSLKAIRKILRFLRKGYDAYTARVAAVLPEIVEGFDGCEEAVMLRFAELQESARAERNCWLAAGTGYGDMPPEFSERFRDYLLDEFGIPLEVSARLYWSNGDPYDKVRKDKETKNEEGEEKWRLPAVSLGMIRNPVAQRAMTVLRRLVNTLRRNGTIDGETEIHIELARNVNSHSMRKAIQGWQEKLEKKRAAAREELAKLGIPVTEDLVDRYILREEQNNKCLYTGRSIDVSDLVEGAGFDIEHTIPRSRSGDDSMANKTLCDAKYNREVKKGRIPAECPNYNEPAAGCSSVISTNIKAWKKDKVQKLSKDLRDQLKAARAAVDPGAKDRARTKAHQTRLELDYWRDKLRRFEMDSSALEANGREMSGFMRRQLVDTGVMCSHAVDFLHSIYPSVHSVNGQAVAFARKAWGVQSEAAKDRSSHVHHAKDAIVIAALSKARFNAICTILKDDGRPNQTVPPPCRDFAKKVADSTEDILVKHLARRNQLKKSHRRTVLANPHPSKSDPGKIVRRPMSGGDIVRGRLHNDTFYGCIVDPNDKGEKKKKYVVRKPLEGKLSKVRDDLAEDIVDKALRKIVLDELGRLEGEGKTQVVKGDVKMPSGVPVNKVRVIVKQKNLIELTSHDMPSAKDYKRPYYVQSAEGSNFRMGVFEVDGQRREKIENLLEFVQSRKKQDFIPMDKRPGFVGYITPGTMAIAAEHGKVDDVRHLDAHALSKRLYKVVKYAVQNGGCETTLRLHTEARASTVLSKELPNELKTDGRKKNKAGESRVDFSDKPYELLRLGRKELFGKMLFEGIDFKISFDGRIEFLK